MSNFVDDIVDDSEDEFWIAASYVSVFKSRRPRLLRGQTNSLTELDGIDFHSRFRINKRCFYIRSTNSRTRNVSAGSRLHDLTGDCNIMRRTSCDRLSLYVIDYHCMPQFTNFSSVSYI